MKIQRILSPQPDCGSRDQIVLLGLAGCFPRHFCFVKQKEQHHVTDTNLIAMSERMLFHWNAVNKRAVVAVEIDDGELIAGDASFPICRRRSSAGEVDCLTVALRLATCAVAVAGEVNFTTIALRLTTFTA